MTEIKKFKDTFVVVRCLLKGCEEICILFVFKRNLKQTMSVSKHINNNDMQRLTKERTAKDMLYNPYTIGKVYTGKGEYLGITKDRHMFKRHTKPYNQKATFGPKYLFEKV